MLNGLDLFSGIGGFAIGLKDWVRPIAYCERDPHIQRVLCSRMGTKRIGAAPIWDDVRTFKGSLLPKRSVDIVYGGFPCQDISSAGTRVGMEHGDRSGLFFEVARIVEEVRPTFVFLENVPDIRTRGLSRILSEFTALRYDCAWTIVAAQEVGAPQVRKRWFLMAYAENYGIGRRKPLQSRSKKTRHVANINGGRSQPGPRAFEETYGRKEFIDNPWLQAEPKLVRMVHGLPFTVDRIRGLGNSVIPLQAKVAFKRLLGL